MDTGFAGFGLVEYHEIKSFDASINTWYNFVFPARCCMHNGNILLIGTIGSRVRQKHLEPYLVLDEALSKLSIFEPSPQLPPSWGIAFPKKLV